jgi:uncharacterized protein (DUF433 family)
VIALLRATGFSFRQIHASERFIRRTTGARRPFATAKIWTADGIREIFTEYEDVLLAASLGGQLPFLQLVEEQLVPVAGLTFDVRGVADSWRPGNDGIVLDPAIQFGAPCIRGTRIPTRTLWGMRQGGDSLGFIAEVYGLEPERVEEAIQWEKQLAAAQ